MPRVSRNSLPRGETLCPHSECVYWVDGNCNDVANNKGNSDAVCHKMNNKDLLKQLNDFKECFENHAVFNVD